MSVVYFRLLSLFDIVLSRRLGSLSGDLKKLNLTLIRMTKDEKVLAIFKGLLL